MYAGKSWLTCDKHCVCMSRGDAHSVGAAEQGVAEGGQAICQDGHMRALCGAVHGLNRDVTKVRPAQSLAPQTCLRSWQGTLNIVSALSAVSMWSQPPEEQMSSYLPILSVETYMPLGSTRLALASLPAPVLPKVSQGKCARSHFDEVLVRL